MSQAPSQSVDFSALEKLLASLPPPKSVAELRAMLDGISPLLNASPPAVGTLHEGVLVRDLPTGRVTADVAEPAGAGPHPVLVYLHGGGWCSGSPRSHRKLALRFAEAGFVVVNLGYRLAPEAPFPGPLEDCLFAVRWAARQAERFDGDPARIAIAGDSAGANLAAAAAIALAEEGSVARLSAALLFYGVFDFPSLLDTQNIEAGRTASSFERDAVRMMLAAYLGEGPSEALLRDPRVSPLHGAEKLPPSCLVVGTGDPLLAQSNALAAALERGGVAHEHIVCEGMPHGFLQIEALPPAREALGRAIAFLKKHVPSA
ncbi:MAG TPA: alpha/beta hydrolase [Myxococcota bacterium]|nr:alpha/beta hydrolase [Myxococcota bacterium]